MTKRPRRAVGYIRWSVQQKDKDKVTPAIQQEAIEAYCKSKGWPIVEMITERGKSAGEGKKRPGIDRAHHLLTAGAADVLVIYKLDRASRSVRDFANLWSSLRDAHADFASVTESLDTTTPIGRAMVHITMVFAELERERAVERTNDWHGHRLTQNMTPTGAKPPIGYCRPRRNEYALDAAVAPLVRTVAQRILDGESVRSQARWLTDEGVPVSHTGLARALTNPTMTGHRDVDGVLVKGSWPALLTVAQHEELVALLEDPRRNDRPIHGSQRRWMLAGIASCATCERPLAAKPNAKGTRYFCPACHRSIRADTLDDYVRDTLLDRIDAAAWSALRSRSVPMVEDVAALEADLGELAARYAAGDLLKVEWEPLRAGLLRRIEDAARPVEIGPELPDVDRLDIDVWKAFAVDDRRLVLSAVFESVRLAAAPSAGPCPPHERVSLVWQE